MQKLGAAADAQDAVFTNLNDAASNLTTFFHRLVPFSQQSAVSLTCGENGGPSCPGGGASLGSAAKVGTPAVRAAQPTVRDLSRFTGPTDCLTQAQAINRAGKTSGFVENCLPELAGNLALALNALDARKAINYGNGLVGGGPVEPDPRSPGGIGYTGLEGVLMYAFNITNAINTFTTWGHQLAVDAFANSTCSPYADPANDRQQHRHLPAGRRRPQLVPTPTTRAPATPSSGRNQPGVTDDRSRPTRAPASRIRAAIPSRATAPSTTALKTNACKLQASPLEQRLRAASSRQCRPPGIARSLAAAQAESRTACRPSDRPDRAARSAATGAVSSAGAAANQAASQATSGDGRSERLERLQRADPAAPQLPALAMRKTAQPAFANPVLIGAVTVLVAIVAVFLAYNANNGLPFVPTRVLKVDFPNGAALVPGNEVEQGGFRVGLVSDMHPVELANGRIVAQATFQLSEANGKVPVDSTATILPRSLLGLKYVKLTYGHSSRFFPDGGTMPLSQTTVPVQFDDINTMFDAKTRPAVQQNLVGYGDVLAARGSSLNDTISSLPALFGHLRPVAAYLSDPHTELTRFLGALNGFFSTDLAGGADELEAVHRSGDDVRGDLAEPAPISRTRSGSRRRRSMSRPRR